MPNYLLDTQVVILALRSVPGALNFLGAINQPQERPCISVTTRTEILAEMRPHEAPRTLALLDSLVNLPISETIADQAGQLIHQYARQGVQLPFPDAQIAATALQFGLTLVTTHPNYFSIGQLKVQALQ